METIDRFSYLGLGFVLAGLFALTLVYIFPALYHDKIATYSVNFGAYTLYTVGYIVILVVHYVQGHWIWGTVFVGLAIAFGAFAVKAYKSLSSYTQGQNRTLTINATGQTAEQVGEQILRELRYRKDYK